MLANPTQVENDQAFLDRIARSIVQRRLTTPAILLLESSKPLNFVGSQFLMFAQPIVRLFVNVSQDYDRLATLLEHRDTVERLICAIEKHDDRPE